MEDLKIMVSDLEAERDYYRNIAERLGRSASADADGFSLSNELWYFILICHG